MQGRKQRLFSFYFIPLVILSNIHEHMKAALIIDGLICLLQVLARKPRRPLFLLERDMFGNLDVQRLAISRPKEPSRVPISAKDFPAIDGHFQQKLDHFNDSYVATWQQLYYYNFKYSNHTRFKYAFLLVGGEGPIRPFDEGRKPHIANEGNIVVQWAKQFGAALFALEHRFYGESRPTADMSVENLKYLNSQQAIEDIAYFIKQMNRRYGDPIWIAFGASYSGSLALWARQKYPELIAGAVASSAPMEITLDFWGLKDGIGDVFRAHSETCAENIEKAFAEMSDLMKTGKGRGKLQQLLAPELPKSAEELTEKNVQHFFHDMSIILNLVVIRDPVFPDGGSLSTGVNIICGHMDDQTQDPLNSFVEARNVMREKFDYTYNDTYTDVIDIFKDEEFLEFDPGQRQWFWQSCTEFGMFETTNGGPGNIFGMGVPLSYFVNMCTEVFGPKYNIDFTAKAVRETNIRYGGADGYRGTNAVITNGRNDPWTRLGKTTSYDESVVCFQITGAAHCADFAGRPPGFEIPEVEDARRIIVENIEMWLQRPSSRQANLEQTWEMPRARTVYPKSKPIKASALPSHKAYPDWSHYKRMHLGRPPMGFVRPKPPKIKQVTQKAKRNFITQPMNHFNDEDMRVFQQKYYINSAYAKSDGPIFLIIGGETPMSSAWVEGQDMFHMVLAQKFGATVFALEHRYYGDSIVGGTVDDPNPDLKYLSSLQMLHDVAHFIRTKNTEMENSSPWITFGGSYGGSLSIWMRVLFPDLVAGAVGSSPRLEAKLDFYEFMQLIGKSLGTYKDQPGFCKHLVSKAFEDIWRLTLTREGRKTLSTILEFKPKWGRKTNVTDLDREHVFSHLYGLLQHVAYRKDFVDVICKSVKKSADPLKGLSKFNQKMIREYRGKFDHTGTSSKNFAKFLRKAHQFGPDAGAVKLWTWQACTEFGFFPTTDSADEVFVHPTPLNYFTQICSDVFGEEFTTAKIKEGIDKTNSLYGGLANFKGTNVVVTAGLNDPWHILSHLKIRNSPSVVTLLISGGVHCEDMFTSNIPNVQTAQGLIEENVENWIKSARSRKRSRRDPTPAKQKRAASFKERISKDCKGYMLANLINYKCLYSLLRNLIEEVREPFRSFSNTTVV